MPPPPSVSFIITTTTEMLEFACAKGIRPTLETFKLSDINAAMARVASGKARFRVVMETDLC